MKQRISLIQVLVFSIYFLSGFKFKGVHANVENVVSNASLLSQNISLQSNRENQERSAQRNNLDNGELEPSLDIETSYENLNDEHLENLNTPAFSEVFSQNSGVANEIINNDTPVVLSFSDTATAELQNRANIPAVHSENGESHFTNISQDRIAADITNNVPIENTTTETPEEGGRSDLNISNSQTDKIVIEVPIVPKNLTETNNEEIPSFSEWAQKQLEEVEKKEQVNSSIQNQNITGKQGSKRWKNYASLDCGAKVVMANPEAGSPWAILSPSKDEYKLNTCTTRIWFIVELCESIQVKKIDLANYELFSSSPKDFTVWVSDRFPTRDWSLIGHFTAKDERNVQSFDVNHQIFGKYIKVEIKSHYGSEHYCPLSLFRAYGTSVFEVLQKEDPGHVHRTEEEDDDDDDETLDVENGDTPKNILTSATDAVISMVKKAAEVLGNKVHSNNQTGVKENCTFTSTPIIPSCRSPSHYVVCNNCSDLLFGKIFELLSCRAAQITNLVSIPFIKKALLYSDICHTFGFDFKDRKSGSTVKSCPDCIKSFFPTRYLGALCNSLAILQNKVVLNVSTEYSNTTEKNATEELVNINTPKMKVIGIESAKVNIGEGKFEEEIEIPVTTAPLTIDTIESIPKASCSTDISYASDIKPTKSLPSEIKLNKSSLPDVNTKTTNHEALENVELAENLKSETTPTLEPTAETNQEIEKESLEPTVAENIENVDENLDSLISEFNGDNSQNVVGSSSTTSTLQAQKESVFIRLSNRIKALERNMSLSSQYLEELSKRYKKQVEEMQRLMEKTVLALHEDSKKKDERNRQLEERLDALTNAVENLVAERNSWKMTFCWSLLTTTFLFVSYTFYRGSACTKHSASDTSKTIEVQRRQSIDVVTHKQPQKKRRRPSDQAMKIVASSVLNGESERREKLKKKRKKTTLVRSNSINTLNEPKFLPKATSSRIWNQESQNFYEGKTAIEEVSPFALDESEHSTLEALPTELSKIDAPSYLKSAVNSRLSRVQNIGNGAAIVNNKEKCVNFDENMRYSPCGSVNGSISSGADEQTPKKEKRGFKKLFKKGFLK